MNLRAAFLAQEAQQNSDGTFMVWRGGITDFQVTTFPILLRASLVLRIEADAEEARTLHTIRLRIVHSLENPPWQEIPAAFKTPEAPQTRSYLNLLVSLHFGVVKEGNGQLEISVDGEVIAPTIMFAVQRIPMPPGFPHP